MTPNEPTGSFERIIVDDEVLTRGQLIDRLEARLEERPHEEAWLAPAIATLLSLGREEGLVVMTSGTTGPPKPIVIPAKDLVASAELTGRTFGLGQGHRAIHCLPSEHVAGKMMWVRAFVLGLNLHLADPRGSILDHVRTDLTDAFVAMIPLQLHRALREDQERVERQFSTILLGGGPVSDALVNMVQGLRSTVHLGYGSTETVTHVALRTLNGPGRSDHFKAIGACGFARDPRGCLVVYTPHLDLEQHVTNDVVELIDDRCFNWFGRYDNVILSGGKKIFPEQLEARTAGIIPYPHYFSATSDDLLGQAVMLTVETSKPEEEVLPVLMDLLMPLLHPHERPRRIITLARIERTTSGKMRRD